MTHEIFQPEDRLVRPFSFPASVRIKDERTVENRLDDVAEGVMDDAVPERGGRNQPSFRVEDVKLFVLAKSVILFFQFFFDLQQSFFHLPFETDDIVPVGF